MKFLYSLITLSVFLCSLASACGPASSSARKEASPTIVPEPTSAESLPVRIHLVTTSDWTNLFLVSGATCLSCNRISADKGASTADIQGNQFILIQAIDRAAAGESVGMVVEMLVSGQERASSMVFRIERGNIGSTRVEFSRFVDGRWLVVKTETWDGVTGDGKNTHNIEVSFEELFGEVSPLSITPQALQSKTAAPETGRSQGTVGHPWWNDSVFYEIFVRSFYDSNGDGIGDFNGILRKLDYLNDGNPSTTSDLGITGIWLMPIFPSPSYHGYDVTDYYSVNSDYGTMADFKNLLSEAHKRGIRVILDLVLNHTSSLHPWFQQAADPNSSFHDWYIWSDMDPGYTGPWGEQVWHPMQEKYYYGVFSARMPDLNYRNPAVVAEMEKVAKHWLDLGVDGFRLDGAKHILEEGNNQANTASTHAWWKVFHSFYKEFYPQAVTVGEIWDTTPITAAYLQGDEFDLSFDFYLAALFIQSVNEGNAAAATDQLQLSNDSVPAFPYAPFLTNHDQDRLMNQLGNDPQKVKAAASLLLTAPGVPFIYYGEEIGMKGQKPDEQIRAPMQWSAGAHAGFSPVVPWQSAGPDWNTFNVSQESTDPKSILSHYRTLIQARNQHAALRLGDMTIVSTGNDALYAILRICPQEAVLVLVNLTGNTVSDYSLQVDRSLLAKGKYTPIAIVGTGEFAAVSAASGGGFSGYTPVAVIPPYATFILQLK